MRTPQQEEAMAWLTSPKNPACRADGSDAGSVVIAYVKELEAELTEVRGMEHMTNDRNETLVAENAKILNERDAWARKHADALHELSELKAGQHANCVHRHELAAAKEQLSTLSKENQRMRGHAEALVIRFEGAGDIEAYPFDFFRLTAIEIGKEILSLTPPENP